MGAWNWRRRCESVWMVWASRSASYVGTIPAHMFALLSPRARTNFTPAVPPLVHLAVLPFPVRPTVLPPLAPLTVLPFLLPLPHQLDDLELGSLRGLLVSAELDANMDARRGRGALQVRGERIEGKDKRAGGVQGTEGTGALQVRGKGERDEGGPGVWHGGAEGRCR